MYKLLGLRVNVLGLSFSPTGLLARLLIRFCACIRLISPSSFSSASMSRIMCTQQHVASLHLLRYAMEASLIVIPVTALIKATQNTSLSMGDPKWIKIRKMKDKKKAKPPVRKATALQKGTLEKMLAATYEGQNLNVDKYNVDPSLSDERVKVYHDPTTKHTVVAHRGSAEARDWYENALYATGLKMGKGWRHSKQVQREAEKKYGLENLTTIGHSKGALHAQQYGKRGGEIITLNKPVALHDLAYKVPKKQTDFTAEGDAVSLLRPLQRGNKEVVLKKKEGGLLTKIKKVFTKGLINYGLEEHGTGTLKRLASANDVNSSQAVDL